MFHLVVAVVCLANLSQALPQPHGVLSFDGKVVGGDPTFTEGIPYEVLLRYFSEHYCGAVTN